MRVAFLQANAVRRLAFALGGLVALCGAGPLSRSVAIPARDGVPAHATRVLLWSPQTPGPHPFLLYQPSWGGSAEENSRLAAALAQSGFSVAAVDYATDQPAGFAPHLQRMRAPLDLSSRPALDRTVAEGDWRVVLLATDASVLLDLLPEVAQSSGVGILGWSFGGAVAVEACRRDPRFQACLNMDGWMFGPAADQPSPQPYLVLSGDAYPDQPVAAADPAGILDQRDAVRLRARFAAVGGCYAELPGLTHDGFSNAGDGTVVQPLVTGFFTRTLLGAPASAPPPGVRWRCFPGPAA